AIAGGVDQLAREGVTAGPARRLRMTVIAGRDDHDPGVNRAARGRHPPAIAPPVEVLDLRSELDPQVMRAGVVLEVLDPLLTRGKVAGPPPDVIAGLGRHPSERVQAQAPPCSPAPPHPVTPL